MDALGLHVSFRDGHRRWAHTGGASGFLSANITRPDEGIAITVLTNGETAASSEIARRIENIVAAPAEDPGAAGQQNNAQDHGQDSGATDGPGQVVRLIVVGGLTWEEVQILRAYRKYRMRVSTRFTEEYRNDAMAANPQISARLVELFEEARFSPHVMNEGHRDTAVDALRLVLADLRSVT